MPLHPNAAQNLRDWAFAIEAENDWHPFEFLKAQTPNMSGQAVQTWFEHFTGLTDDEMHRLFRGYSVETFFGDLDFNILFRLFLAEAIDSGDIA